MIVLNRTQITEVVTKRQISHILEIDGVEYDRHENIMISMNYMGIEPVERDVKIKWSIKVGDRTHKSLPKKEWKILEAKYQDLMDTDRNAWNGNGRIWETYNKLN